MLKSTVVAISMCFISSLAMWGQDCTNSNKLVCQIPVATRTNGTSGPAPAFNSTLATQLSQLPLASASSGIVLVFDKKLNDYVPSENLGPILTERAQTIGKHKIFLGFSYQRFRFNAIDGTNLSNVPLVSKTPGPSGSTIYLQEIDHISMALDQYVGIMTVGLTSKTDFSVVIPWERISMGVSAGIPYGPYASGVQYFVSANNQPQGTVPFFQYVPGSASGIGDALLNLKQVVLSREKTDVAVGGIVRLPSGDPLNYLGSGAWGFNPYGIVTYQWTVSPHARLGYIFNSDTVLVPNGSGGRSHLPGGLQYDVGADTLIWKKFSTTLAADLLGYYVVNSPYLIPTTTTIPGYGLTFPNLEKVTKSYNSDQLSIGIKAKPISNLDFLIYANVLWQLNNVGLRSNLVPLIGISYKF